MSLPEIRVMTHGDIDLVMRLQEMVGWGNTRADAERSLYYEPSGCFVASIDGVDVGIVNSFLYGDVGFIGNLIVLAETRGKGVGAALMTRAMERLTLDGAGTIRLDGVQKAIPLYERLGFKGEYWSLRYSGVAAKAPHHSIEPMIKEDLEKVAKLDRRFFGLDRAQKLRRVQHDFPELCFKASKGGELYGFIMAKPGVSNVRVGPWICDSKHAEYAEPLLNALSSKVDGRKLWVGVPELNKVSVKIVEGKRFTKMPPSLRMSYGVNKKVEDVSGIFGIGAPDKG
ncbi:MAG: GNAT family N-acetyltransferase [Candidatus Bathyarchaeota archaeon]|nr:GNAT family N-acetyltransferase [Candidatus Bathyarchaeota archaeon]